MILGLLLLTVVSSVGFSSSCGSNASTRCSNGSIRGSSRSSNITLSNAGDSVVIVMSYDEVVVIVTVMSYGVVVVMYVEVMVIVAVMSYGVVVVMYGEVMVIVAVMSFDVVMV